jgi:RNA polymerase sigma-70 factor (ECF subfamily)
MEFDEYVHQHSDEIYAYLWRMLRDSTDAEDCLQEVFLKAYKAYPKLRPNSNPRAWLYKIATNTAKNHLRKASNHREVRLVSEGLWSGGDPTDERDHTVQEIYQALLNLPFKQRTSLLMRKYQELTYEEIGAALNCSSEAARANVYQGLKKLRSKFKPKKKAQ